MVPVLFAPYGKPSFVTRESYDCLGPLTSCTPEQCQRGDNKVCSVTALCSWAYVRMMLYCTVPMAQHNHMMQQSRL